MKEKKSPKKILIALGLVLLLAALLAAILIAAARRSEAQPPETTPTAPMETLPDELGPEFTIPGYTESSRFVQDLGDGLYLVGWGSYSGLYLEDGSNEPVENVAAIILENRYDEWIEYAELTADLGGKQVVFSVSALASNSYVFVMAADRAALQPGAKMSELSCETLARMSRGTVNFDGDFAIYPDDGVINVQNISEHDFRNDIFVCYKNYLYGLYFGGICYRARFSGGLERGAIAQSMQSKYSLDASAIMYMIYDE